MTQYDALYLSPHLDDVALSCGGRIHQQTSRGLKVGILTPFAGDLRDDTLSPSLFRVYSEKMGLKPSEAMPIRRREDLAACERLDARPIHWEFVEALSRHPDLHSVEALFAEPPPADDSVVETIAGLLREYQDTLEIFAPLGIGGHMDHLVVRRAAERAFPGKVSYYEDFPYSRDVGIHDLSKSALTSGLGPEIVTLDSVDVAARIEAIQEYVSQVKPLFCFHLLKPKSWRSMRRQVSAHIKKCGGERYWTSDAA